MNYKVFRVSLFGYQGNLLYSCVVECEEYQVIGFLDELCGMFYPEVRSTRIELIVDCNRS
jgi:hypothetical protein